MNPLDWNAITKWDTIEVELQFQNLIYRHIVPFKEKGVVRSKIFKNEINVFFRFW